jgi:hypothetical protein
MAGDEKKPGAYPPDPRTWKPPVPPSAMLAHTKHMVKTSTCGTVRRGDAMVTNWDEMNCAECLKQAPFRRR